MAWTTFSNRHWIILHTNPTQYTKVMMDDFYQSILQTYVIQMGKKWHFCNLESSFLDWRCLFLLQLQLYFLLLQHITSNLVVVCDDKKPLLRLFISKVEDSKVKWFIQNWGFNPCKYCGIWKNIYRKSLECKFNIGGKTKQIYHLFKFSCPRILWF